MTFYRKERRKYFRYNTKVEICFRVNYDLKTKVKFQVIKQDKGCLSKKHLALSKNVSVEGMCFSSNLKLKKGDNLYLEVYLPKQKNPVCMTAQVRWSKALLLKSEEKHKFDTGVRLMTVSGKPVSPSIRFDKKQQVVWSDVLDSIFGSFRKLMQKSKGRIVCS